MSKPDLWTRVKEARIVQVLLVYLGACWGILQVVDVLQGSLELPEWITPVCVILLLVGLVILLATAWVQAHPMTAKREEEGEVPTDWQVAPKELVGSLRAGQIPHLTWGRSLLGGLFALSLMFGLAGLAVIFGGPITSFGSLGPAEAGANTAPAGIAVVPFDVVGEDLGLWREGMVDVLSTNMDGMGGYRAIDSRTVMARWRERVEGEENPDLRTSLEVAASTGARFGMVGGLVGNPAGVRVSADIYDLSSGDKVAQSWVEGGQDQVLELVGELSVDLTRKLLEATGGDVIQAPRTASLTTSSLPALRAFLEGEAAYRHSDFAGSVAAFERAVEIDSTFALAWSRLAGSYQWLENINSELGAVAVERAWEFKDRLPARDRVLLLADRGMVEGDLSILGPLKDAVRNYPDDPEAWYLLADFYYHFGVETGMASRTQVREAFEEAVRLDPTFTPYHIHLIEEYVGVADTAKAADALATYQHLAPNDFTARPYLQLAFDLYLSPRDQREEVLASLDTVPRAVLNDVGLFIHWEDYPDKAWVEEVLRKGYERTGHPGWRDAVAQALLHQGKLDAYGEHLMDPTTESFTRLTNAFALHVLGLELSEGLDEFLLDPEACGEAEDPGTLCLFTQGILAAEDGNRAQWQRFVDKNRDLAASYAEVPGQGSHGLGHKAAAEALEGLWAFHQEGDVEGARRTLQEASKHMGGLPGFFTRWMLADILDEARPREAMELRETMGSFGYAQVRAGRLRERTGDVAGATEAYQTALREFRNADPDNPYLVEAIEALRRLAPAG